MTEIWRFEPFQVIFCHRKYCPLRTSNSQLKAILSKNVSSLGTVIWGHIEMWAATQPKLHRMFCSRSWRWHYRRSWPPQICDLTPLMYYLWAAIKNKRYADNMLKNWTDHVGDFMTNRGSHLNEYIFIN